MKECKFQDKLQYALKERGCYVRSLVGNMLSAGLPDLLVITPGPSGLVFHIENKVWRKRYPPTCKEDIVSLFEGPQRNVIPNEFWARGAYCPILVFEDVNIRSAFLYDNLRDTITRNDWMVFVEYFAKLKSTL
jgi:hypothetical protein